MKDIKKTVKKNYGKLAKLNSSCCAGDSCCGGGNWDNFNRIIGYSDAQLRSVPDGANLGLGCGNPLAIASLKPGDVVLDLGSGAGFDAFLASSKVGDSGKVIGVDMTEEMVKKARKNAARGNYTNVEFRKGDIEALPVETNSIDVIISNCVINLAPNKKQVFKEAYRVLKPGGRMMISDVILTKQLPDELKRNEELLIGCVSGAIMKKDYFSLLEKEGFIAVKIHKIVPMFLEDYAQSVTFSAFK